MRGKKSLQLLMDNAIQMLSPIEDSRWNERVLASKNSSIFHSSNWAHVLSEAYHYTPLCFSIIRDDTLTALVPVMEINSIITGKRGVSLPFTIIVIRLSDASVFEGLLGHIIEHGRSAGWKSIELRTESALPSAYTPHRSITDTSSISPGARRNCIRNSGTARGGT
jgi:hypothetical protein